MCVFWISKIGEAGAVERIPPHPIPSFSVCAVQSASSDFELGTLR